MALDDNIFDGYDCGCPIGEVPLNPSNPFVPVPPDSCGTGGNSNPVWGTITGNIQNQLDLIQLINSKDLTFDNGLTRTGNNVQLGGIINEYTSIASFTADGTLEVGLVPLVNPTFFVTTSSVFGRGGFQIGNDSSRMQWLQSDFSGFQELRLDNTGIAFRDELNFKGAGDYADYSANKTDWSYITKKWALDTFGIPLLSGSGAYIKDGKVNVGLDLTTLGTTNEGMIQGFLGFYTSGAATGADHTSLQMADNYFEIYKHVGGIPQSITFPNNTVPAFENLIVITDELNHRGLTGAELFTVTDSRDYIQKGHLDAAILTITADNGLTKTGNNIQLGGPYTDPIFIGENINQGTLNLSSFAGSLEYSVGSTARGFRVKADAIEVFDYVEHRGLTGAELFTITDPKDYTQKGYVDGLIAGSLITANNGLTKTGNNIVLGGAFTSNIIIGDDYWTTPTLGMYTNGDVDLWSGGGDTLGTQSILQLYKAGTWNINGTTYHDTAHPTFQIVRGIFSRANEHGFTIHDGNTSISGNLNDDTIASSRGIRYFGDYTINWTSDPAFNNYLTTKKFVEGKIATGQTIGADTTGNAGSATTWGGQDAEFGGFATGTIAWLIGTETETDVAKPWNAGKVKTFLATSLQDATNVNNNTSRPIVVNGNTSSVEPTSGSVYLSFNSDQRGILEAYNFTSGSTGPLPLSLNPNGGKVGIGINATPTEALDVNGKIKSNTDIVSTGGDLVLNRTDNEYAYVLRSNTVGKRKLKFATEADAYPLDEIYFRTNSAVFSNLAGTGDRSIVADATGILKISTTPFLTTNTFQNVTAGKNFIDANISLSGTGYIGLNNGTKLVQINNTGFVIADYGSPFGELSLSPFAMSFNYGGGPQSIYPTSSTNITVSNNLTVTDTIKSNNLAGTGTRPLSVAADGTLVVGAATLEQVTDAGNSTNNVIQITGQDNVDITKDSLILFRDPATSQGGIINAEASSQGSQILFNRNSTDGLRLTGTNVSYGLTLKNTTASTDLLAIFDGRVQVQNGTASSDAINKGQLDGKANLDGGNTFTGDQIVNGLVTVDTAYDGAFVIYDSIHGGTVFSTLTTGTAYHASAGFSFTKIATDGVSSNAVINITPNSAQVSPSSMTIELPNQAGTLALTKQAIDYEVTDSSKGLILKDITLGTRHRITLDNGVLVISAAL